MNDDDLLFGVDDLERWKNGELPDPWFEDQKNVLVARCQVHVEQLKMLLATASPALAARLHKRL